ncbi:hypothetical protein PY365_22260 [Roseiarcaceae bacterium H3SJ34-1]|uniref:hypothetical protein n=1 Tax=Terripilifer ovatus TaxID=3032367 RepID=UPI003AB91A0A|nr:hypothetical protein [Roseiarcaceae bacterium H3SJ34-1]
MDSAIAPAHSPAATHDRTVRSGYRTAFVAFMLAWGILCSPWLSGELTIPYDAKAHFQAQLQFLANALHTGQSPFWTPNIFAGSPQIADPQSLIFSPAIFIAYFFPQPTFLLVDTYVLALLGCSGLAILLFFRDRGWHPVGAIVAALAFSFGASAAWRIQHVGQIQSFVFFAISLWLLSRALDRKSTGWGIAAGLSVGLMVVKPDQVAFLASYLLIALAVVEILRGDSPARSFREFTPILVSAAAAALVVAAAPLILTYLFLEQSSRPEVAFAEAVRGSFHPASLLTGLVSDLYGAFDPKVDYWGPYSMAWSPNNRTLSQNMGEIYVGAIPVVLILTLGLARGMMWEREIRFFSAALLAMIIYALGEFTPLFHYIYALVPGVSLFRRPADATFMIGGLMAIIAGYLIHRLVCGSLPNASRRQHGVALILVPSLFAISLIVAIHLGHTADAIKPLTIAAICVGAAVAVLWIVGRLGSTNSTATLAIVLAFMVCDLHVNNGPNESTALPVASFEVLKPDSTNETIRLLKAKLRQPARSPRRDRIELLGLGFSWPNLGLVHGFDHILGYNPLHLASITKAIGAGDTIAGWDQRRFTPLFPSYRSMLADMLGIRYVASAVPIERVDKRLKPGDLILFARTRDAYVYENPRALPRVMFVPEFKLANFAELIDKGDWPAFDPKETLLLEQEPPHAISPLSGSSDGQTAASASIVSFKNTIIEVDVSAPRPGFVLFNSAWHPWWRATVDGAPVEVLKANVLFRAVQTPAGKHRIRFEFEPFVGAFAEIEGKLRGADLAGRAKAASHRPRS